MLFNSLNFAIFLPIVFLLYWFVFEKKLKFQNMLLLVSSYIFYGFWDWRFLFLLAFSTLLDYCCALKIAENKNESARKFWFWISIIVNIGFLGVFKYYDFFAVSFAETISYFGLQVNITTLNLILPVGISFYTFHGLSYIIDVYKKRIKPEKNIIDYSLFVGFFPLLVAGPIERATHLLPQIKTKRYFDYTNAVDGLRQILWGLFKKVVIADQCAQFANLTFNNPTDYSGSTLVLGAVFFAFQIYGDFSGYSDIAIGTARLFGIELLRNFNYPYFSRDIAEFWRRWHISLSTWFRDYLYIPLGGSQVSVWNKIRNIFIIFLVSGFWHGANWTFIIWGLLHALYIMPSIIFKTNRNNIDIVAKGKIFPNFKDLFSVILTFSLTVFAWIFFRSETLSNAFEFISIIFSKSIFLLPDYDFMKSALKICIPFLLFIAMEWLGREKKYPIENIEYQFNKPARWLLYGFIIFLIGIYMQTEQTPFIYFNF